MEKGIIPIGDLYLDTDSDPKINKGSDYILNTIMTSDGRKGVAINYKGNEWVYYSFDNYGYLVGWCFDTARNRVILFTEDGGGNGAVEYYEIDTSLVHSFIQISGLHFSRLYPISANIIGDLLYWTDGLNSPRKVNYIRADNYSYGVSTTYKYGSMSTDIIDAYKKPGLAISVVPISSSTNIIRSKSYQWTYRYVYTDSEKSVLSPYSIIRFTDNVYYPNGEFKKNYGISHYQLIFTAFKEDVIYSEIYVRDNEKSDWYLYDVINKPLVTQFTGTIDNPVLTRLYLTDLVGTVRDEDWDLYNSIAIGSQITSNQLVDNTALITAKGIIDGTWPYIDLDSEFDESGRKTASFTGLLYYQFYDNKLRIKADQKDLARPFDYIPRLAGRQELIEKNRLIYGDITEGFDPVNINTTCSVVVSNSGLDTQSNLGYWNISIGTTFNLNLSAYPVDCLYGVEILEYDDNEDTYSTHNGRYVSVAGDTVNNIIDGVKNSLIANGIYDAFAANYGTPSRYTLRIYTNYGIKTRYLRRFFVVSYNKQPWRSIKFGDSYLGGITYYDKNLRHGSVNKFSEPINVPLYYAPFALPTLNQTNGFGYFRVNISSIPPDWAYYYSIDFSERVKIGYYIQLVCIPLDDYFFDASDKKLRIRVNALINDARDENPHLNVSNYTFEKGDRLRIIGTSSVYLWYSIITCQNKTLDVEIEDMEWPSGDAQYAKDEATTPAYKTDANGNKILNDLSSYIKINITEKDLLDYTNNIGFFSPHTLVGGSYVGDSIMVEIYRPKKESDNPYYYPSIMLEIGNPTLSTRYHKGINQHQNPNDPTGTPAIVTCNPGDTYTKLRDLKDMFVCQDDHYSDYYTSNYFGFGKPNIFDANAKKSHLTTGLRYSGRLFENTKTNELNRFDYDDLVVLKSEFGQIRFVKEVGDVLKILHDKKERSIYVGKEEIANADGSTILRTTNNVLGNINTMDEIRGTSHSNSVVVNDRDIYYWDDIRKEVIRSSPNGQMPISEYGMKTWFKNITGYTDVIGGWDETNNMYFITFVGTAYTLGFYDPKNGEKPRWISFFSFVPENYVWTGTFFASFKNSNLYKHNSNSVSRCNYYGTQYKQQIDIYFNDKPVIKKLFRSLGLNTNKAWSVPSITIEADASYIRGFLSKLNAQHFTLKEGQYYSEFLNNMYTSSSVASNLDLINGERLRGSYIKLQLENTEVAEVWLLTVSVNYDISNYY